MTDKFYSMLGLGKKAGYLMLGETGVIQSIKRKKSHLVIIASNATENTKDRIIPLCEKNNVAYYILGEKEQLGYALGKSLSSMISITDLKFSEVISKIIKSM